ncbi:MAG TPA: glucose-6-phosphate dehydrogenase, partial [Mariprofundaceae bacterium]|nr:glucose-6-phosphate dehydrogenase [Mariprofundaceae bacterium]
MHDAPSDPCLMVIFGASGDLTKRLLVPSLFNLYCDGLLPEAFAILGMAMDDYDDEGFRAKMNADVRAYLRRSGGFDEEAWGRFSANIHYQQGDFDDAEAFRQLARQLQALDARHATSGNILFYMATPPSVFNMISSGLHAVNLQDSENGWRRIIVEKPFGSDLASARELNREILSFWREDQIFRIDHYLGKEPVQN